MRLPGRTLRVLVERHGGRVLAGEARAPERIVPAERARDGDLAPLLSRRFVKAASEAGLRGAALLVDAALEGVAWTRASRAGASGSAGLWIHPLGAWAMAELLDDALVPDAPAVVGHGCSIAPSAVLGPRVVIGARVNDRRGRGHRPPGLRLGLRRKRRRARRAAARRRRDRGRRRHRPAVDGRRGDARPDAHPPRRQARRARARRPQRRHRRGRRSSRRSAASRVR